MLRCDLWKSVGYAWGVLGSILISAGAAAPPLETAHAHNDYYHDRPLLDALDQGFCSVEADVFLIDGKLLVAHTRFELNRKKTLDSLYLKPLATRVKENGGRVYPDGPPLTLLIDFKSSGTETYEALSRELIPYRSMLTRVEDGKVVPGAVQIIISGSRPTDLIAKQATRDVFVDGRLSDLESPANPTLVPLISDRWTSHFKWRGRGEISAAERQKLDEIVAKCHARGERLRFWATPDVESVWRVLHEADVDLINTDNLAGLAEFLNKQ